MFSPHQDDEMRCLGTLVRLHEQGQRIGFVCVTNGDKGLSFDGPGGQREAAAVRQREMLAVASHFDAEYLCLEREDGFAVGDHELRTDLIEALRRLAAEVVFTHWTSDYNDDHVVTAKAVTDAALFTGISSFGAGSRALPRTPRIFHTHPGEGFGFEATHFVPLSSAHVRQKATLIRRHESQMDVRRRMLGYDYADEMADHDRGQGARLSVAAAEAFRPCLAERRVPWPSDLPGPLA
ncbi:PIG-L deacetylase family protein [Fodinicola feengrottensis]|uniref:PIG-L deacetylase family protein n=1 Tax=Fodinicola feengrottensis TaxID=435914 RepID=UPI0024431D88|nr:PIG-L family deacetylase [Fodinicola feengrottensis]